MTTATSERIEVTGVVQGVGFRPFVHRLADELGLSGHCGNDSARVFIEVSGPTEAIDRFVGRLTAEAPPMAVVDQVTRTTMSTGTGMAEGTEFVIVDSEAGGGARTLVPPDSAVCADCRRELFDPSDPRYLYPFINCTNCGPRFTIIRSTPYDRRSTTMAGFPMCRRCEADFRDQTNRRYHAQPIGCHECGPTISRPISSVASSLASGQTAAIKGLGGYHLACDASDDDAVRRLRDRKHRPDKPFAVMVADLDQARRLAHISPNEAALLQSPAAPIVLLRRRTDATLSPFVAPGNPLLGVMLAYTPVHLLLFAEPNAPQALVMTSANRGGEPMATTTAEIVALDDLYDLVLDNDRPIHVACDDSLVRVVAGRLLPVRRARGYAPMPVAFDQSQRSVLAVGGELKNTFCLMSQGAGRGWVSQHIGDMENLETVQAFETTVEQFKAMYAVAPELVVADAHPGYSTSAWARQCRLPSLEVQHHHAHIAAVMAEQRLDPYEPVIGFAFDGTGYGDDGSIWGGELLVATVDGYRRAAHLAPIKLPGGDAAIRNPNRVALAHLYAAGIPWTDGSGDALPPLAALSELEQTLLLRQLERGVACVPTTSMGRLFDAVASLLGLRHEISYEAQAAIDLEIVAEACPDRSGGYRFEIDRATDSETGLIQGGPVLRALLNDRVAGVPVSTMAWRFHDAVAAVVERLAVSERSISQIDTVVLSGGVFQNALLTESCLERLESASFTVLTHRAVPPNDGGLALGQAYIGAHRTDLPFLTKQAISTQGV